LELKGKYSSIQRFLSKNKIKSPRFVFARASERKLNAESIG